MKRTGIANADLAARCAALRHTDRVAIADCGLPVPVGVPVVDLALVQGVPSFADTLTALLDELVVEAHTYATESAGHPAEQLLRAESGRLGEPDAVSHEDFKTRVARCVFAVRTGEATPYANIILHCGVAFA